MTAVEWLLFELSKNGLLPDGIPMNVHNKAKEMEKELLAKTWNNAIDAELKDAWMSFEQYYNETFKN